LIYSVRIIGSSPYTLQNQLNLRVSKPSSIRVKTSIEFLINLKASFKHGGRQLFSRTLLI
jgi:hypothetical protein